MSANETLSFISQSKFHRRWRALTLDARRVCLELITSGQPIEKAIKLARKI